MSVSNVRPMAWHREALVNWRLNHERQRQSVDAQQRAFDRAQVNLDFYAAQIAEADKRGVAGFDPDRLMKPRTHKQA